MIKASAAPRVVLKPAAVTIPKASPTLPSPLWATQVSMTGSAISHVPARKKDRKRRCVSGAERGLRRSGSERQDSAWVRNNGAALDRGAARGKEQLLSYADAKGYW